jgi:tRNA(fMet)-specific endonuclease VapC
MFVLDTNTLVYFFRGQGRVAERLLAVPPASVVVPAVALYELETGIAKSTDSARRRRQLDALLEVVEVLPFGRAEAGIAAEVRAALDLMGTPIGPLDTLIAATALACGGVLVTRNLGEFRRVPGLTTVDWFGDE